MRRIFITVAEVSADHHAAELAQSLRQLDPTIVIEGHGGSAMRAAGVTVHQDTVNRATMLIRAALRGLEFWRLIRWTRHYYRRHKPDLHICIDSSGINLHFAKMARSQGVPVLYYIAPQLWASREGRIKKVQKYINRVACILPFEEAYYRRFNVDATFVGHPLFDELPPNRPLSPEPRPFTSGTPPRIGLMPGSRKSEVRANWPHMLNVADRLRAAFPGITFDVPTTPPTHELVKQLAAGRDQSMTIQPGAIDTMAPHWDFCLAKSGTTTLHVAAYAVPMVIVYRLTWLGWNAVGRFIVKTPWMGLVNILAQRQIVPEIIPWHGSDQPVADLVISFLNDVEKRRHQRRDLLNIVAPLDQKGASHKAAQIALEMIPNAIPSPGTPGEG